MESRRLQLRVHPDNLWRKNRRVFSEGVGVDHNRNYPSAGPPRAAVARAAARRPTEAPRLGGGRVPHDAGVVPAPTACAKVLDFRGYGRECSTRRASGPSSHRVDAAAGRGAVGGVGLRRHGAPSAEGEHPQWQFATLGAYTFLIEIGTEFQPSYTSAVNEAATVWPGILWVLERPISVSGHVTDAVTGAPLAAKLSSRASRSRKGRPTAAAARTGWFHMLLPPGTYDVRFSRDGYAPVVSSVTVTDSSATTLDVPVDGCDRGVRGHLRDRQGMDAKSERHRHGDARSLGARRSAGHVLERRQAARHDGERRERPRHGTALGFFFGELRTSMAAARRFNLRPSSFRRSIREAP